MTSARLMAPSPLSEEIVVDGRYDLSPLDRAVAVGVVPGNQGVPLGHGLVRHPRRDLARGQGVGVGRRGPQVVADIHGRWGVAHRRCPRDVRPTVRVRRPGPLPGHAGDLAVGIAEDRRQPGIHHRGCRRQGHRPSFGLVGHRDGHRDHGRGAGWVRGRDLDNVGVLLRLVVQDRSVPHQDLSRGFDYVEISRVGAAQRVGQDAGAGGRDRRADALAGRRVLGHLALRAGAIRKHRG